METDPERKKRISPAQQQIEKQLNITNSLIASLSSQVEENFNQQDVKKLKEYREKKEKLESELKKLKLSQERSAKNRKIKKKRLAEACTADPELAKKLKLHEAPGRPSILIDQPELIKVILDIIQSGASADARRQTDVLRYFLMKF